MPNGFITTGIDPLQIEKQIIEERAAVRPFDFAGAVTTAVTAAQTVAKGFESSENRAKARQFEQLLQAQEPGMRRFLQEAQTQGVDVSKIPDPKLYLTTRESQESWWKIAIGNVEKQQEAGRLEKQAELLKEEKFPEAIIAEVEVGKVDVAAAAKSLRLLARGKKAKEVISSAVQGAVKTEILTRSPQIAEAPKDILGSIDTLSPLLGASPNLITGIISIESAFNPLAKNPDSTASGLGQLIDSTGRRNHAELLERGLVEGEYDPFDARKNILYTSNEFRKNLDRFDGNTDLALLSHRVGPGAAQRVLDEYGGDITKATFTAAGEDITEQVIDWMTRVKDVAAAGTETFEQQVVTSQGLVDIIRAGGEAGISNQPDFKTFVEQLRKATLVGGVTAFERKEEIKFKELRDSIDLVIGLAQGVEPTGRFVGGAIRFLGKPLGLAPKTANLSAFSGLLAGQFAKRIGGESGRLTDQDRIFALAAMPKGTDTKEERRIKIEILQVLRDKDLSGLALRKTIYEIVTKLDKAKISEETRSLIIEARITLDELSKLPGTDEEIGGYLLANDIPVNDSTIAAVKKKLKELRGE